jgi:hypothetical protein
MAKRKWPPNDFERDLLQYEPRTSEQFAWTLLYAVKDLFPDRIAELEVIGDRFRLQYVEELPEDDPINLEAEAGFARWITEWSERNGIACPAVHEAAEHYALNEGPSGGVLLIDWPSIEVRPAYQTRADFLRQAGELYDSTARDLANRLGGRFGQVKHSDSEHFRYLAAHLVGRCTWAEVANGDTPFHLRIGDQRAIAAGAKHIAAILEIPMPKRRGARKGARRHPRPAR